MKLIHSILMDPRLFFDVMGTPDFLESNPGCSEVQIIHVIGFSVLHTVKVFYKHRVKMS
jgi:hypothetical protein